jgi:hypothetical protein
VIAGTHPFVPPRTDRAYGASLHRQLSFWAVILDGRWRGCRVTLMAAPPFLSHSRRFIRHYVNGCWRTVTDADT